MTVIRYMVRFLLVLIFVWAGIEKLFLPYNPSVFKSDVAMADPRFFEFYDFLMGTGYLYFVGFFQLLNGILLIFRRTYLLASIMMVPLLLCLLMTQILIGRYPAFILFDSGLFCMNAFLVLSNYQELKLTFLKPQTRLI
ncbi:MAG: hypothetical protein AAF616_15405 [Bacteroidota bacterium]